MGFGAIRLLCPYKQEQPWPLIRGKRQSFETVATMTFKSGSRSIDQGDQGMDKTLRCPINSS